MRLIDYFERGHRYYPDRACLIDGAGEISYREVAKRSHRTANALIAGGLKAGDRVAILSPNSSRAFEAWIGAARAGGVWVGLAALASADENAYVIDQREAAWLFYDSSFEPAIAQIRAQCPKLRHLVCLDRAGSDAPSFEDFIAGHGDVAPELPDDRDAVISHFTSGGTTGRPKGAMWSNLIWEAWCANVYAHLPIKKPPVHLVATSMAHGAGVFAWPAMAFGGTTVCIQKADPLAVMEAIDRHGVTHTFMPPTVIYMMLAHPRARDFDYSTLDYFVYGGAPMSADKAAEAIDLFGPCMTQIYGQAECPCTIGILTPADHLEALADPAKRHRLLSCGRPPVFVEVEMMDDDGKLMPTGEWGEIVVRGTFVSLGYFAEPGGDGGNPRPRLAPHRRHRLQGRGRLRLYRRPQEGHDHLGRAQRLPDRDRARDLEPPGGAGLRRDRRARREVGRGGEGGGRAEGRRAGERRRSHRPLQAGALPLQGAEDGGVLEGAPAQRRRQGAEAQGARALLGRPRAENLAGRWPGE